MRFKTWRKEETEVNTVSQNGNLAILRRFLRFCETIGAVEPDFVELVPMPNVPPREEVSDDVPDDGAVEAQRAYYREFEYASRRQCNLELIAEVGLRMGAVRAIDLEDFHEDRAHIRLRHRPEGPDVDGTPLKNGFDGERIVNLSEGLNETILDYIEHHRKDEVDDYGRAPLFTTDHGRITTATMRRDFYKLTRPCVYAGECPHDREIRSYEATSAKGGGGVPIEFQHPPPAALVDHASIRRRPSEGPPERPSRCVRPGP